MNNIWKLYSRVEVKDSKEPTKSRNISLPKSSYSGSDSESTHYSDSESSLKNEEEAYDPWGTPFFSEKNPFAGENYHKGKTVALVASKELPFNTTITLEIMPNSKISDEGPNPTKQSLV